MKYDTLRFVGAYTVDMPIVGADASGPFILKGVDGLGPVEIDVSYAQTTQEGGVRQQKRAQNRQVVARVGLAPAWNTGQTPDELREILYGLLTPKFNRQVLIQIIQNGSVLAQCAGDVSKMETAIWTADPEVQITTECDYPYLRTPAAAKQLPARSVANGQTLVDIQNPGSAPSGFWTGLVLQSLPANGGALILTDDDVNGQFMNLGKNWAVGDTLQIDTRAGQRGVWKIKAGQTAKVSMLNDLTGASSWLQLHGSTNRLHLNVTAFDWYGDAFVHTPAFWGV